MVGYPSDSFASCYAGSINNSYTIASLHLLLYRLQIHMIYCAYCIRPKERPVKRRLWHSQTIVSRLLRCRFDALRAYYVL